MGACILKARRHKWRRRQGAIARGLLGEEPEDDIEEFETWIDEFNERFAALADVLRELEQLMDEGPSNEWQHTVGEIVTNRRFPAATVAEGDANYPEDPIPG